MGNKITLTLQTVSPLLMFSANQESPEIRVASFRGVFRYWMRTLLGATFGNNTRQLFKRESTYFGSTEGESLIRVRISSTLIPEDKKIVSLPPDYRSEKRYFDIDESIKLIFDVHPLAKAEKYFDTTFWQSLLLAFNFGAFGKRSRRGAGALRITQIEGIADFDKNIQECADLLKAYPQDRTALETHLRNVITKVSTPSPVMWAGTPTYPVFQDGQVQVFLSQKGGSQVLQSLKPLWTTTSTYHHNGGAWGKASSGNRRASAFHIRVHRCTDGNYFPLVTVLHSGNDWNAVTGYYQILKNNGFSHIHGPTGDFR